MSESQFDQSRGKPWPRRSGLFFGGLILLVLLAGGGVSTFALSQALHQHETDSETLTGLYQTEQTVFRAEVAFKRQIQEWKDLLLRGRDVSDFSLYRESFLEESRTVATLFTELKAQPLTTEEQSQLSALRLHHQQVTDRYLSALGPIATLSPEQAFVIDREVRGIDRESLRQLDAFVLRVEERIQALKAQQLSEEQERYDQLRRLLIGITALSLVLVLGLELFLIFRHNR